MTSGRRETVRRNSSGEALGDERPKTDRHAPLRFKLSYPTEEEFFRKYRSSLSRGGVFVATRSPKAEGTTVSFEVLLADGRCVLKGMAQVAGVRDAFEARPGMTLRFLELDADSRERLERVLSKPAAGPSGVQPEPPGAEGDRPPGTTPPRLRAPPRTSLPEPVLGLDAGTLWCRAAVELGGKPQVIPLEDEGPAMPALVAIDDQGRIVTGHAALARLQTDPSGAVLGVKRLLGRRFASPSVRQVLSRSFFEIAADDSGDAAVRLKGLSLTPAQLGAAMLGEVKQRASEVLGRSVERAVLAVPGNFSDRQRQAARQAAGLAGLKVERVLSAPLAAAVAFGFGRALARKRLLVCDCGAGAFDAALIQVTGNDFDLLASGSDPFAGGLELDLRIATWLEQRFAEAHPAEPPHDATARQRLRQAAEAAKIALSSEALTRVHVSGLGSRPESPAELDVALPRTQLDALAAEVVSRAVATCRAVLESRGLGPGAIDELLLIGGQSRIPVLRAALEAFAGKPASAEVDPSEAVARGAALIGRAMRDADPGAFELRCNEALPAPIGFALRSGRVSRVLERNTALPCAKTAFLPGGADGTLKLALYQGDAERCEDNEYIGALNAACPPGEQLLVVFALSPEGVLELSARSPDGKTAVSEFSAVELSSQTRAALLAAAPLPDPAESHGLLNSFKRLLLRRGS